MNHYKSNTSIYPPSPMKKCTTNLSSPLPSGLLSVTQNGEELSIRPISPHRYNISAIQKVSNTSKLSHHTRSSTHTSGFSRFLPATELLSFEDIQMSEKEKTSDSEEYDEISSLYFEDEPKHSLAYPTLHSNRTSMIGSTTENPSSTSSPIESGGIVTITGGKRWSYNEELQRVGTLRTIFIGNNEMVYCGNCKQNVNFSVKVRELRESFWQRFCCGLMFQKKFVERVILCKYCYKEIARIKFKKE